METQIVAAVFEAGKLVPLQPLNLDEHERVEVTVVRAPADHEKAEDDYVPYLISEADFSITLEQVQQALAKIPDSLVEDFVSERDERF